MTKPTGRPRGRPKNTEYAATLMARMSLGLAEQANSYATRNRQTISEVLRDGLQLLLANAHEREPLPMKSPLELHGALFFGCHQCEYEGRDGVMWVNSSGKAFVFCDNDCLREWINKGEERIVREIHQEYEKEVG